MFRFLGSIGIVTACIAGFVVVSVVWILLTTPRPTDIRGCIVAKMYEVKLCPKDPNYAPLRSIAPIVRHAVVASEDGSFYTHDGFDWFEMRRSFERNWEEGRFARGGSTITQQLAKNVYLTKEKSLLRKVREALIVVQLEKSLTKDDILEKYLNVVEFGPNVFGIGAASRYYFHRPPSALGPVEAAFIAFLLPNPKKYSSSFRARKLTPFARKQIKAILVRLNKTGKLGDTDFASSLADLERMFGAAPEMKNEGLETGDEDSYETGSVPSRDESVRTPPRESKPNRTDGSADGLPSDAPVAPEDLAPEASTPEEPEAQPLEL